MKSIDSKCNRLKVIEQAMEFTRMCLLQSLCTIEEFEEAMKKLKKEKEAYAKPTD